MSEGLEILLTNDDGIEATGFRALYDALDDVAEVTAVAPATDQSAVGRAMSNEVGLREHELGYAIEGTPADCVVAGLASVCRDPDVVVSGVNKGANLGAYVLGRSGTVSAAVEAAFFDVPAVATSLYVSASDWGSLDLGPGDYEEATRATAYLVDNALDAGVFEEADYLNVNAPRPSGYPAPLEITSPSHVYEMDATHEGDSVVLHDRVWERMAEGDVPDPQGTDRRAVVEGRVSVSPLTAPHTTEHHEALDDLVDGYADTV